MNRSRGMLFAAAAAVGVVLAGCGGGTVATEAAVTDGPAVLADCDTPEVEPRSITIACADEGFVIDDLEWESWGADEAAGTGTARVNDCEPSCAAGEFRDYDVDLTLSKVADCHGAEAYTEAHIDFTGKGPPGFERPYATELACEPPGEH